MQLQLQANSYLSELQFYDDVMHEKLLKTSSKNKKMWTLFLRLGHGIGLTVHCSPSCPIQAALTGQGHCQDPRGQTECGIV